MEPWEKLKSFQMSRKTRHSLNEMVKFAELTRHRRNYSATPLRPISLEEAREMDRKMEEKC